MSEYEVPASYGWICPKCGKVLAPWVSECECYKTTSGSSLVFNPGGTTVGGSDYENIATGIWENVPTRISNIQKNIDTINETLKKMEMENN